MKNIIAAAWPLLTASVVAATPQTKDIQEVLVTGSLFPVDRSQMASAFSVVGSQQLENRAPLLLSDMLRDVPGVAVSRNGVLGSSTQIRLRGSEANHTLVLVDGVEVNDAGQDDALNWGTLMATDIERVEVIRGPQSALHGSDAIAGVVNIITRRASSPFSADVFSEAGSHETYQSGISIGTASSGHSLRIGGAHLESKGENISRSGNEADGYRNTTANLKGTLQVTDQLGLELVARYADGRNNFDETDFLKGIPVDANSYSNFRAQTLRASVDYDAFNGRWLHKLSYGYTDNENDNFSFDTPSGTNESSKHQYRYLSSINWDRQKQSISFLLEHETEDFSQRGDVLIFFGDVLDPNQDRERDTDSAALEYRASIINDRVTLAASARHDDNSEFESSDTYRAELGWHVTDSSRLRTAWGTAVKNPTFSERFGFFTNFIGNPDLQPEESESWELGFDQQFLNGGVELALTWFSAELDNEINGFVFDLASGGFTAENVDGNSHRQGIELELSAAISEQLNLHAAYSYTDATQEDSSGRDIDEIRRPRHIGSLTLAWQVLEKLQLNLNAEYNGAQKDQDFSVFPARDVVLDDYTLLNLNATFQASRQLDVYARLENVLDEDYEEIYGYRAPGFGGYLGVRYRFVR